MPRYGHEGSCGPRRCRETEASRVETVFPTAEMDSLISQSDYLVLTVPVTPETLGLMNAARLARMKPGRMSYQCRTRASSRRNWAY